MQLTIVVPAYNEERRIGRMLDAYLPYFSGRYGGRMELIVVINGSTDRTAEIVRSYQPQYACLRCVVIPEAVGKGGALMLGFAQARGALIGFVDADGATPPEAFQALVDHRGTAGGIIASRWRRESTVSPHQPLSRRIASRIFNTLTRVLFGLPLTDTQCGAKLMERAALLNILPRLGITRWAFDVDLLFQLRRAGCVIKEIPTVWRDVEGSKVQVVRASLEMMIALLRLRLIYSPLRWVVAFYDRTVGSVLRMDQPVKDRLVQDSLLLFAATQVGNVANFVFQILMMRMLSPNDYGSLMAIFALWMVLSGPLAAVGLSATHFSARFVQDGAQARIRTMLAWLAQKGVLVSLVLGGIVFFARHILAAGLNLPGTWAVMGIMTCLVLSLFTVFFMGILNGVQAFGWSAVSGMSWCVIRLLLVVPLVWWVSTWQVALLAHVIALACGLAVAFIGVSKSLGGVWAKPVRVDGFYAYGWQFFFAMAGYSVMATADVVLVKRFFDPAFAGAFAKSVVLARMVFFLPQPIATALFPKVVSRGESSRSSRQMLLKAFGLVLLVVGVAGAACLVLAPWLLKWVAGAAAPDAVGWFRGMVLALSPLALIMVLINYELAQRRFAVMVPLMICAVGYVAAGLIWHESVWQIIGALGVSSLVALVWVFRCVWKAVR
jgi:glycosyltransferase involved in cell wall biosynthesis/O-antigen/teichoic acid export membrane protein